MRLRHDNLVTAAIGCCVLAWWLIDQAQRLGIVEGEGWSLVGLACLALALPLVVLAWRRF